MMKSNVTCPVCKNEGEARGQEDPNQISIDCPSCGKFILNRDALYDIERNGSNSLLSAWIRNNQDNSKYILYIDSNRLATIQNNLPNFSPSKKQLILLQYIEKRSEYAGAHVDIDPEYDYPLVWTKNKKECEYLIQTLIQRKLVTLQNYSEIDLLYKLTISPDGWDYIDKHSSDPFLSDQVFVAMSFSSELQEVYEDGIKPAIEKAGYKAYRIDKDTHSERIDSKIMTEIMNSRFIVADVTGQKQGVYFEAGFALGINRPVLWCVKKTALRKVHRTDDEVLRTPQPYIDR